MQSNYRYSNWVRQLILLPALLLAFSIQAAPQIQTWQTANGANVLFLPAPEIPMLDVRIVFDAGGARDNGLSGLALLTNGLLVEGAAGKTSQQIAEDFESVGAQVSYSAERDMAVVGVRSLTENRFLQKALVTLKKVLSKPEFPPEAFQRELNRMKVAVKARKQSPAAIASEAFYRALYGDHPYASPVSGTEESLEKITRQAVEDFYKQYYVAANATVAIIGKVDRAQAEKIVNDLLSDLPKGEKAPALPAVRPLQKAEKIVIDYPSAQTHIYVGQPGMKRGDPDYLPLYVANHIFGGSGFSSRLMKEIREDRGLAYSVYSYFSPMREPGPFTMGMQTKNDQAGEALQLLNLELEKFVSEGPTEEELKDSLSNITGSFPLGIDSNSKLLGYLAVIGFYGLPIDYLDHFIPEVSKVSVAQINDALKRRLEPGKMVTVIVGKQQ